MNKNFEQLEVWKRSCQLTVLIYQVFDGTKDFGFYNQVTRAAVSVPSNIAEGSERQTKQEFIQFLYIAKGSVAELRTQLYLAARLKKISHEQMSELTNEAKEISQMLQGLINSIKKSIHK